MGLSAAGQAKATRYQAALDLLNARRGGDKGAGAAAAAAAPPPPDRGQAETVGAWRPPPQPVLAVTSVRAAPAGATVTTTQHAAAVRAAAGAVAGASRAAACAGGSGSQVAAVAEAAAAAVSGGGGGACTTPTRPPAPSAFATPQRMWRPPPPASPGMVVRRPETGPPLPSDPDGAVAAFKAQASAADWADAANARLAGDATPAAAGPPGPPASTAALAVAEPVKLWCEEVPNELGASYRQFLAASFSALWRRSRYACVALAPDRHLYEVLREGRPTHLYFDLEFVPAANPGVDGDGLVDALVDLLAADMRARWGLTLNPADHVLEADSSTPDKWSRHLAVRLPDGAAFRDGQAVGRYVSEVLSHAAAGRLRVRKKGWEIAVTPDEAWTWVVDTAVYTRNRHFRTMLASKFGKGTPLMPTPRFVCGPGARGAAARPGAVVPPAPGAWALRELWLFSLASAVEPGSRLVDVGGREAWVDAAMPGGGGAPWTGGGGWRGSLEEACALLDRPPRPPTTNPLASPSRLAVPARYALGYKYDPRDALRGGGAEANAGPPAPDPALVALVQATTPIVEACAAARAGGLPAYVRRATVCGLSGEVVVYTLLGPGSHWCGRKGGHHKNNNIYFLVNYAAGGLAQKCHDPDCGGWASEAVPLPEGLARQAARFLGVSGSGAGMSLEGA